MPELFANSEVNRDQHWHTLLQLFGLSLAFHVIVLGSLIYVPAVRDALNIAALLGNTGFVDKPYEKTEIEDVQLLSLATDKFHYPPGYFLTDAQLLALAQPQSNAAVPSVTFPRFKERAMSTPTPTPTPAMSPEASPSPSASVKDSTAEAETSKKQSQADPKSPEEIEEKLQKIAQENSVARPNENEINTRPLKEWLARANELKLKGGLDLSKELEITIAANLNVDCRLSDANVLQKSGDARLTDVAKEMVAAIGDSGMLSFLRDPNKNKDATTLTCDEIPLQLTIKLDQNEISAKVESQADSPERAAQMAKGYNGLLSVGQLVKQGHDEETLYKNTRVTAEGNHIIVSFSMPRQTASELLQKQLPPSG